MWCLIPSLFYLVSINVLRREILCGDNKVGDNVMRVVQWGCCVVKGNFSLRVVMSSYRGQLEVANTDIADSLV